MQIENWVDGAHRRGVDGDHHHRVVAVARVASLVDHHQAHRRAVMIIGDHRQVGMDGIARLRLAVESLARVAVHPPHHQAAAVIGGANHGRRRHHLERVARAEAVQASLESQVDHRHHPAHRGLTIICGAILHHGDIHRLASLARVVAESLARVVDHQALRLLEIIGDILDGVDLGANLHLQVENRARVKDPRVARQAVLMENGYGLKDGAIGDHHLVESLARVAARQEVNLSMLVNGLTMDGVVLPNLQLNRSIQREVPLVDGKLTDGTMMDITRLIWIMYELRL